MSNKKYKKKGYIGVDLDGTLAQYDHWRGIAHIGEPVPEMVDKVKRGIAGGKNFRIFTARAHDKEAIPYIKEWLLKNGLPDFEVTNEKNYDMYEFWDDRAKQVIPNTGKFLDEYLTENYDVKEKVTLTQQ